MTAFRAAGAGLVCSGTSRTARPLVEAVRVISAEEQAAARITRMKKNVLTSARLHVDAGTSGGFRGRWAMLTLTFREGVEWEANQISKLLQHIRMYAARSGFKARYVWVLELTKRLRPHYHVLVWLPKGRTLPKPDKQGWWAYGMTQIEWAKHAVGYIAKYASKGEPETLCAIPRGARLCGVGGLENPQRIELRWWKSPVWVRQVFTEITDLGRVEGGGWVNRQTGEYLKSPWVVLWHGGALVLFKVV